MSTWHFSSRDGFLVLKLARLLKFTIDCEYTCTVTSKSDYDDDVDDTTDISATNMLNITIINGSNYAIVIGSGK